MKIGSDVINWKRQERKRYVREIKNATLSGGWVNKQDYFMSRELNADDSPKVVLTRVDSMTGSHLKLLSRDNWNVVREIDYIYGGGKRDTTKAMKDLVISFSPDELTHMDREQIEHFLWSR